VTEDELKTKLCGGPPVLALIALMANPARAPHIPPERLNSVLRCQGSTCASFRRYLGSDHVYCGLAGKEDGQPIDTNE